MTSSFKRQAIIVAGMHRSGTSAITRVLSLLGADLPKNIAPPIPGNNETGFWESVNLMVLHDKLLASAGSSWSDWTEFNEDWYLSAEGKKYYTEISSVIQADFEFSSLFVVKDPRICRILPLWLNLLQDHDVEPFIVIPVRNPLEVAKSLKARDGFPLAKGGLIWLRHVLDAVFFTSKMKVAFVSYEQLMTDWKAVVHSITQQCGLYFPRISVSVEMEIDKYLDDKQKHNNFDATLLKNHSEFAPLVVEAYELLHALTLAPDQVELRERLLALRSQFNADSLLYAKVLNATEVMYEEYRKQSIKDYSSLQLQQEDKFAHWRDQQSEAFEARLRQQSEASEAQLKQQGEVFEAQLKQHIEAFEARLKQQSEESEARLKQEMVEGEERMRLLSVNCEDRISQLDTDYLGRLDQQVGVYENALQEQIDLRQGRENYCNQQIAEYETRLNRDYAERKYLIQLNDTQRNDLSLLRLQLVTLSEAEYSAESKSQQPVATAINFSPCNTDIRKAKKLLTLLTESPLFDAVYYRQTYPELADYQSPLEQHFYFSGGFSGFKPHVLFDSDFYQRTYPDVVESKENPLVHFLQKGGYELRQTHPLFDVLWYVRVYPDVAQGGQIPLLHYLQFGGRELRNPHPLFLADYYVDAYPEVAKTGLPALVHYLKYGAGWRCNPHPLFDGRYYLRQLGEDLPHDVSALEHFLGNKKSWRISPCACFDSAWYLDQYPDVWDRDVNPLLHYVLHGHADGRKPHPAADTQEYRNKYAALFARAHLPLENKNLVVQPVEKKAHLAGRASYFEKMVDFPKRSLRPLSNSFVKDKLIIHWVTCDFAQQGGGGNMTIFRFVRLFELLGHQQHIWLHNQVTHQTTDSAYEDLVRHYQQTSAHVHFIEDKLLDATGDIVIATDWESVWPVLSTQNFKRRFYFVQDHEPSFFAAGGTSLAAEMTYREELDCICAGPWLEKLMRERYGRWACKFWLAADQQIYYPAGVEKPINSVLRIAFYARASTSRRAVELGLLALELLSSQGKVFHVDIYGSNDNADRLRHVSFSYTDHGVLSASGLGELYRQCDVGVVFSATNYSLVPQEMMACGLAVLELDGDNTRSVFPSDAVALTLPHPRYIAEKLGTLLEDSDYRTSIARAGMIWAQQFDWEQTARDVNTEIQSRLQELGYVQLPAPCNPEPVVTVVIPTLNGGDLLFAVLDKLKQQKTPWPFEVLVIDSGSDDGTLEVMQKRGDLRVHSIPKVEFSHGGTRNLGVELSSSEYIAFLTQDALPVDDFWLFHLVSALEHEPDTAGAFGKHLPYPNASPFVKRDLMAHFENMGRYPLYLDKKTDARRFEEEDQGWRQVLHFYSDNNSCLRRSVWEQVPYPVIEYGEDQVWADQIIKAGYKKAYAINAVVYHSHDYDEQEVFERSKIEARFFQGHFGYEMLDKDQQLDKLLLSLNEHDRSYAAKMGVADDVLQVQYQLNTAKLRGWKAGLL